MKTFLIIGITLVAGLFIAGAFAVSTAGSTAPPAAAVLIDKTITANGIYDAADDGADGFSQVTVNVPATTPDLIEKTITANGIYDASDDGADGFSQVTVNVPAAGLPVDPLMIVDCGGVNTNVIILNRFYADHFGDGNASGDLILNVCGVYWNVRDNLISLDNGTNWINTGSDVSYSGYQMWQCYLINLPNPELGVTAVTNTLEFVELKEFVFGQAIHEYYDDGNFHPLTTNLSNWYLANSLTGQITNLGFVVDEEIYD